MMQYMDDRLGFIDTINDTTWMMDDYGTLIQVPFTIGQWYFQEI